MYLHIDEIGLSQLYLNQEKLHRIQAWFDPLKIDDYEPLPVRDFLNNGKYVLTDGHTRAYIYYKSGMSKIPVMIDQDEIVTSPLGNRLYREYMEWCNRFRIITVKDLEQRIIPADAYEFLWLERCNRLYHLMKAVEDRVISVENYEYKKKLGEDRELQLYGTNEELCIYYYEDLEGKLFLYKDGELTKEYSDYLAGRST